MEERRNPEGSWLEKRKEQSPRRVPCQEDSTRLLRRCLAEEAACTRSDRERGKAQTKKTRAGEASSFGLQLKKDERVVDGVVVLLGPIASRCRVQSTWRSWCAKGHGSARVSEPGSDRQVALYEGAEGALVGGWTGIPCRVSLGRRREEENVVGTLVSDYLGVERMGHGVVVGSGGIVAAESNNKRKVGVDNDEKDDEDVGRKKGKDVLGQCQGMAADSGAGLSSEDYLEAEIVAGSGDVEHEE